MGEENQESERKSTVSLVAPPDKFKFVLFCFTYLGACTLLPWNFFCTATTYFQFRLRTDKNSTIIDFDHLNNKQIVFPNQMAIFSMIPLALTNIINLLIKDKINASIRIIVGFFFATTMFIVNAILIGIEVSDIGFLTMTFIAIIIISIGCALYQGSLMGIASMLPGQYIGVFLQGQAVAGIITSLTAIGLAPINLSQLGQAGILFSVPIVFIILGIVLFYFVTKSRFFIYHLQKNNYEPSFFNMRKINKNGQETRPLRNDSSIEDDSPEPSVNMNPIKKALSDMREIVYCGLGAFFGLGFTLAIFPALLLNITPMDYRVGDPWTQTYFKLVVVLLTFNVFDYIGRFFATIFLWPRNKKILLTMILARIIFVIIIMFFNQAGKKNFPIIFHHDAYLVIFVGLMSLSNGYLLSLCFTFAPRFCTPGNEEAAGVAMGIYLSFGLCFGVCLSYCLTAIL